MQTNSLSWLYRSRILGMAAVAALFAAGCFTPPAYVQTDSSPSSIVATSEIMPGTYPEVVLSKNSQLTRTYLDGLSTAIGPHGFTLIFKEVRRSLREHFAPRRVKTDASGPDLRMILDVQASISGWYEQKISITGVLMDSQNNTIDTIRGDGDDSKHDETPEQRFRGATKAAIADFASHLSASPALDAHEQQEKQKEEQARHLAQEERRKTIAHASDNDDSAKELFKLQAAFNLPVSETTELLLTWKNRHLASLLQNAKTAELRDYVDEIEHTVLQATDASEKEKDEAQRLIAAGANDEHEHTDLARAYRLRIEVLKPILAAIKEEVVNRGK